jgi:Zinc knuckle
MKDGIFTSFGQTKNYSELKCSICKKKGHFARNCRERKKKKKKKDDGLKGATSFTKGQGNPPANKDSDYGNVSSGPKGWFKPLKGEPR